MIIKLTYYSTLRDQATGFTKRHCLKANNSKVTMHRSTGKPGMDDMANFLMFCIQYLFIYIDYPDIDYYNLEYSAKIIY